MHCEAYHTHARKQYADYRDGDTKSKEKARTHISISISSEKRGDVTQRCGPA